jgi:hypothetical protein
MQTFDSEKFQINNNLQNSFNNSYKIFSNLKFEEEKLANDKNKEDPDILQIKKATLESRNSIKS